MAGDPLSDPHRARKSLGQNFLVDPNLQRRIVAAIDPGPEDEVLEIGPGRGALTRHLAGSVGRLILCELDDILVERLRHEYVDLPSVEIVHGDILELDIERITEHPSRLKVIGNIPYNITTPIIFHLLERTERPALIVLMIQREVADRILAEPGNRTYGALAVGIRSVARVERVVNVGRAAFRPAPDVASTGIRVTPIPPPPREPGAEAALRRLTRHTFGHRRKQLQRTLRDAYALTPEALQGVEAATGLDLRARPETLSPDQFIRLALALPEC